MIRKKRNVSNEKEATTSTPTSTTTSTTTTTTHDGYRIVSMTPTTSPTSPTSHAQCTSSGFLTLVDALSLVRTHNIADDVDDDDDDGDMRDDNGDEVRDIDICVYDALLFQLRRLWRELDSCLTALTRANTRRIAAIERR